MRRGILLAVLLALARPSVAQDPLPPPFPRANAVKQLETDRFVVWNIVWPKGQPTALHRHVFDQVGTYYARGGRTITTPAGESRHTMTDVGSLSTTRKGTTHIEEGDTDPPLRAVFIELKHDGPSGLALAAPGAGDGISLPQAKAAFEDERVRVTDGAAGAGAERSYRASADTVIVYLSAGRLQIVGADGTPHEWTVEPGTMRYVPRGVREREVVLGGTPRSMTFEIK